MHSHIEKLANMASKPSRMIIGLMSGTSLDGLDVALCRIRGEGLSTQVELMEFKTIDYDADYKQRVKAIFAKRQVDLQMVTLLHPWIGLTHGRMISQCLAQWQVTPEDIDLVASHGQTVFHCPKQQHQVAGFGNATLQLGDGDHLAVQSGIITISDFRQKHIAAGGEGAPLAVYGDYLLFSSPEENRILLNIGGIANLTYLPRSQNAAEVFSSDLGPGNTIMDAYIQAHFPGQYYDRSATLAYAGEVNANLLQALNNNPFFSLAFPKTTGPEVFNLAYLQQAQQLSATEQLNHADVMATLNYFTAKVIVQAIKHLTKQLDSYALYVSGGGIHNPLLMQHISQALGQTRISSTAELGINPDAKEAVLFAVLANECLVGGKQKFANKREGIPNISMGKISFAD
ncbi:anhydro-N-acetylmuramic acid kinase [Rheinheimera sp. WS51]|uniref:anhydro-N-acetylmuramic acid kinase n=1 Tax=Rheinheimera sp. WS51 TaxID=3425886 RepID=UPI003D8AFFB4